MTEPMQRRTFLKVLAAAMNALLGLVVAIPALRFVMAPLCRVNRERRFIRLAPLSAATAGRPVRVTVSADRWDAYTRNPPGPIGSVWLIRGDGAAGPSAIRCLQVICPHLGCGVDFASERGVFNCPCHASEFDDAGRRRFGPSPRDMDELECRITEADEDGRRWIEVKYEEFATGVAVKRPIA